MEIVETILVGALVLAALALIGLILLQQGRGASVGAAFGSGSANAVFGAQGSLSFIARATGWLAVAFFAIALSLAWVAKTRFSDAAVADVIPGVPVDGAPPVPSDVPVVPAANTPVTDVPAAPVAPASGGPVTASEASAPGPTATPQPAPAGDAPAPGAPQ